MHHSNGPAFHIEKLRNTRRVTLGGKRDGDRGERLLANEVTGSSFTGTEVRRTSHVTETTTETQQSPRGGPSYSDGFPDSDSENESMGTTLRNSVYGLEKLLGRTMGASYTHEPDQEVVIKHLINYLIIDMEKRTHMRKILPYVAFIIVVTMLGLTSRLPEGAYSDALKQTEEIRFRQNLTGLKGVNDPEAMWEWMHITLHAIWDIAPGQANGTNSSSSPDAATPQPAPAPPPGGGGTSATPTATVTTTATATASETQTVAPENVTDDTEAPDTEAPDTFPPTPSPPQFPPGVCETGKRGSISLPIGLVMLRQWRVHDSTCGSVNGRPSLALTDADRAGMPCMCSHKYSPGKLSSDPYGPYGMFKTDSEEKHPIHALSVNTPHLEYFDTGSEFSLMYSLAEPVEEVWQNVSVAMQNGWVDEATRLVSLDTLWYNPDSEQFVRSSCYVEYYQTGLAEGGCQIHPPFLLEVFFDDTVSSCLSIVVYAYLIPFVVWFIETLQFRINVKKNFNIISELMQLAHIASLIWLGYYRGRMWQKSSAMTSGFFYEDYLDIKMYGTFPGRNAGPAHLMFHFLSDYSHDWTSYNRVFSIVIILSWLRVFDYLQHVQTLNMLSETTRHAASGVLRLGLIFGYCVVAFSLAGSVLYGDEMREFETPSHSVSTLLRMFFMEYEPDYDAMKEKEPLWTPVYFVGFFGLCYFLLLNMVLAVIVSSFAQVQELQENAQKQMEQREDQICDMEIHEIRERRRTKKFSEKGLFGDSDRLKHLQPGQSRLQRVSNVISNTMKELTVGASEMFRHTNTQRQMAIELAKDHTARDLKISRNVLKQRPNYYNRVSITKEELKKVFSGHLTKEDVERIFLGVQKKAMKEENSNMMMLQSLAELALELRSKFADLDNKMEEVKRKSTSTAHDVHSVAGYLGSQTHGAGLLKRADERIKDLTAELNKAREAQRLARQAEEAARRSRDIDSLNQEREFLVQQLANRERESQMRSRQQQQEGHYGLASPLTHAGSYAEYSAATPHPLQAPGSPNAYTPTR